MSDKVIEQGDTVKFSFTDKLEDASVFDTSDTPITTQVGVGKLIKALDKELIGMSEGEEKTVQASREEGFGYEDPKLVKMIPFHDFKKNELEPKEGMRIRTPNGVCQVTKVIEDKEVEVNYKNPLAGENVMFDIKVEKIVK
jgi:FKBP-type peptidyl-prolyl cis-trans isomerase 2